MQLQGDASSKPLWSAAAHLEELVTFPCLADFFGVVGLVGWYQNEGSLEQVLNEN